MKINSVLDKLDDIKNSLNSDFLERNDAIDMIILAVISKKHSILIGEPGLAKTAILKSLVKRVEGLRLFDFQMTPATDISELFSGNIKNKKGVGMPTGIDNCDIALIDEFFKGPHATLNSLLSIMNERIAYVPEPQKIPLISLFATSNERPDKSSDSNLLPLYDRFLFRKEMLPVKNRDNFKKMLELKEESGFSGTLLNKEDINILIFAAETVNIGDEIFASLYRIREELRNKQVIVSDRRWRETVKILKANAALNRRDAAGKDDIKAIEPSLWTYYSDIRAVKNILRKELRDE
jgi:MoxR-like ATPase